jgi:hypothetical protein
MLSPVVVRKASNAEWKAVLLSPAKIEELYLLLNDIHVRLEMLKEITATEPNPEFDRLLEEIKMQEVVILAKLAQPGVKMWGIPKVGWLASHGSGSGIVHQAAPGRDLQGRWAEVAPPLLQRIEAMTKWMIPCRERGHQNQVLSYRHYHWPVPLLFTLSPFAIVIIGERCQS